MDVLVMENCLYDRHLYRIYDLKGSERNRFNEAAAANPNVSRGDVWEKCGPGEGSHARRLQGQSAPM